MTRSSSHAELHRYGEHPAQLVEWTPVARPRGVVVVIHGGFWRAGYDLSLGRPLAADLAARGWSTLNLEYRRVGDGGGAPHTFDDVAAGIDLLAHLRGQADPMSREPIVLLGHSAGGHLATWAAARGVAGWPEQIRATAAISQAGVLDLTAAHRLQLSRDAVVGLLGHPPGEADARFDPIRQVPPGVPVWCLHAPDDDLVPISQSRDYVAVTVAAGGEAELVEVTGGHFGLIDPGHAAWRRVVAILDSLGRDHR